MKMTTAMLKLIDIGFNATCQKKNPRNEWLYCLSLGVDQAGCMVLLVNQDKGLIWTEHEKYNNNNDGAELQLKELVKVVQQYATEHPHLFDTAYDDELRDIKRGIKQVEINMEYDRTPEMEKHLKELQERLELYNNNPKIKSYE